MEDNISYDRRQADGGGRFVVGLVSEGFGKLSTAAKKFRLESVFRRDYLGLVLVSLL
jgi:hypothetical protein